MDEAEMIEQLKTQLAQGDANLLMSKLSEVERLIHRPATKLEQAQAADPVIMAQMSLMAGLIGEELARRLLV
jgi:hypothetical protein